MSNITPVGAPEDLADVSRRCESNATTTNHIYIMDSCARGKVVLEEDPLKILVNKSGAVVKPRTTPWIIGTTLELFSFSVSSIGGDHKHAGHTSISENGVDGLCNSCV